jgi:nucleoside-diphosphate-sugar epimerase
MTQSKREQVATDLKSQVVALVRSHTPTVAHTQVMGDLASTKTIAEQVKNADLVCHFAGIPESFQRDQQLFLSTNFEGTKTVVDACVKYNKVLLYASTVNVFKKIPLVCSEIESCLGIAYQSSYNISKLKAEEYIRKVLPKNQRILIYPAAMYGAKIPRSGIDSFIYKICKGQILFYPKGALPIVFVEDVAKIALTLAEKMCGSESILCESVIDTTDFINQVYEVQGKAQNLFPVPVPIKLAQLTALAEGLLGRTSLYKPKISVGELRFIAWGPRGLEKASCINQGKLTTLAQGLRTMHLSDIKIKGGPYV